MHVARNTEHVARFLFLFTITYDLGSDFIHHYFSTFRIPVNYWLAIAY